MGCDPIEPASEGGDYYMAVIDLQFLYESLMLEGYQQSSDFMRGIKAAHDYIRDKHN
jgi:hypothetical protein